jgi:hypothetical protein
VAETFDLKTGMRQKAATPTKPPTPCRGSIPPVIDRLQRNDHLVADRICSSSNLGCCQRRQVRFSPACGVSGREPQQSSRTAIFSDPDRPVECDGDVADRAPMSQRSASSGRPLTVKACEDMWIYREAANQRGARAGRKWKSHRNCRRSRQWHPYFPALSIRSNSSPSQGPIPMHPKSAVRRKCPVIRVSVSGCRLRVLPVVDAPPAECSTGQ